MSRQNVRLLLSALALAALARPGHAYVNLAPTLSRIIGDSKTIAVVQLAGFDKATRTVTLKEIKVLKGQPGATPLVHVVAEDKDAIIPRAIVQWAQPGAAALVFSSSRTAIVCVGQSWYQLHHQADDQWTLGEDRPDLALAFYGALPRLVEGVQNILAGGDAILTAMPHAVDQDASFDLAFNRMAFPGLINVERIRVTLNTPRSIWAAAASPGYRIGLGPADEADLPALLRQLEAGDVPERVAAAEDIRQLTEIIGAAKTAGAVGALEKRLSDPSPPVRLAAAGTILRITHGDDAALKMLADGLASADATMRRDAATAAAGTGKAGAALVPALAKLLQDADDTVRFAALQAIGTLGPVAAGARDAVVPLLDSPDDMMDAAAALGRMGPRAQPVPPRMVKMLESKQTNVREAALRGMAQIGGKEALPAADYIASHIAREDEIGAYNMVAWLALLGPVAKEPAARITALPQPNFILTTAANWAINNPAGLPWRGGASEMYGDAGNNMYATLVGELGERLRPCALALAPQLIAGTAGNVPVWGYQILNAAPEESIGVVAPHLVDKDKAMRERAAVILGHMGPPASSARKSLEAALAAASDEREKNLMAWALREISKD